MSHWLSMICDASLAVLTDIPTALTTVSVHYLAALRVGRTYRGVHSLLALGS